MGVARYSSGAAAGRAGGEYSLIRVIQLYDPFWSEVVYLFWQFWPQIGNGFCALDLNWICLQKKLFFVIIDETITNSQCLQHRPEVGIKL